MATWMKLTLGLLAVALVTFTAMLAMNLAQESATFTFPYPEIAGWQYELTCFDPHDGRSAQENAELSYTAILTRTQHREGGEAPSVDEFQERAAMALQSANQFVEMLESEFG